MATSIFRVGSVVREWSVEFKCLYATSLCAQA